MPLHWTNLLDDPGDGYPAAFVLARLGVRRQGTPPAPVRARHAWLQAEVLWLFRALPRRARGQLAPLFLALELPRLADALRWREAGSVERASAALGSACFDRTVKRALLALPLEHIGEHLAPLLAAAPDTTPRTFSAAIEERLWRGLLDWGRTSARHPAMRLWLQFLADRFSLRLLRLAQRHDRPLREPLPAGGRLDLKRRFTRKPPSLGELDAALRRVWVVPVTDPADSDAALTQGFQRQLLPLVQSGDLVASSVLHLWHFQNRTIRREVFAPGRRLA